MESSRRNPSPPRRPAQRLTIALERTRPPWGSRRATREQHEHRILRPPATASERFVRGGGKKPLVAVLRLHALDKRALEGYVRRALACRAPGSRALGRRPRRALARRAHHPWRLRPRRPAAPASEDTPRLSKGRPNVPASRGSRPPPARSSAPAAPRSPAAPNARCTPRTSAPNRAQENVVSMNARESAAITANGRPDARPSAPRRPSAGRRRCRTSSYVYAFPLKRTATRSDPFRADSSSMSASSITARRCSRFCAGCRSRTVRLSRPRP